MPQPKIHNKTGNICLICEDDIKNDGIILHKTRRQTHILCNDCFGNYLPNILVKIKDKLMLNIRMNVNYIQCPGSIHSQVRNLCKHKVNINKIQINEKHKLYTDLFRIIYVLQNDNAYICKNNNCGNVIDIDNNHDNINIICLLCKTSWCKYCNVTPYHENKSCIEYEVENQKTTNSKFIWDQKQKGLLKFCPSCKSPTIKYDGCNKITCSICHGNWCWICLNNNISYDHFKSGNCYNKLWDGVDINNQPIPAEI
jgi:hypothetical protein